MATMNRPACWVLVIAGLGLLVCSSGCGQNKFQKEVETEKVAVKLGRHMAEGEYEVITTAELKSLLAKAPDLVLVDAMPLEASYKKQHITGAVQFLFPKATMQEWDTGETAGKSEADYEALLGEDKDKLVVVYCGFTACGRSHNAALWAKKNGYKNVKRYPGGIFAWKGAGLPTVGGDK